MSQLFGFQINKKVGKRGQSPVPPAADEPIAVAAGGYYGTYVDTDNQAVSYTHLTLQTICSV